VGARVVRGRDWSWGSQDGGAGNVGTLTELYSAGYVWVSWDSGGSNVYGIGAGGSYDLFFACLDTSGATATPAPITSPSPSPATTSPSPATTSPPPAGCAPQTLVAEAVVGARVVRGRDWTYGGQDGGAGNLGTITGASGSYASVRWDVGGGYTYFIGVNGRYDLFFAC